MSDKTQIVAALLAQANDPGATPAEAEAFMEKAMAMMAKYEIEEAAVAAAGGTDRPAVVSEVVNITGTYYQQRSRVLGAIGLALGCQVVELASGKAKGKQYVALDIIGQANVVADVLQLFTSADLHCCAEVKRQGDRIAFPSNGDKRAWKLSFIVGYAAAVGSKLSRAQRVATEQAEETYGEEYVKGVALERIGAAEQVEAFTTEKYPRLRTVVRRTPESRGGMSAGRRTGETFGTQGLGTGARGALGA